MNNVIHYHEPDDFENHSNNYLMKQAERVSYRLVSGDNYEGLSVREVYYDKKNKIVGWGEFPMSATTQSTKQLVRELIEAMHHIDNMLEATKKPILEEKALRQQLYKRLHGKK